MDFKILVHEAEEGGYWAEVAALPGCVSQGGTMDELLANMREAIQAWLNTSPPDAGEPAEPRQGVELSVVALRSERALGQGISAACSNATAGSSCASRAATTSTARPPSAPGSRSRSIGNRRLKLRLPLYQSL